MSYGPNIKSLRERDNLSQKELAEKLAVTPQAVSRWEQEAVEPSLGTLKKLSSLFNVSVDVLLSDAPIDEVEKPEPESIEESAGESSAEATEEVTPTQGQIIGTCSYCGKPLHENDDCVRGRLVAHEYEVDGGRATSYTITEGPDLICSDCVSLLEEDSKHQEQHADDQLMKRIGKGWAIRAVWIGIILAICIPCQVNFPSASPYIAGLAAIPIGLMLLIGTIKTVKRLR
jgi:transcriptional regulator with XRE-family HTH domain